ncbi:DUF2127 domain-containing protein [Subtercola sp. RTI3]|uniref:DUF2127 domain-containing protein n=1 Tax=Subtercola sp. RTI3 TaxID=3048639 RepID=UPI002B223E2D|nr:DUF2127 domain-containing protein [Subtercola sp. RTI3]MEA9986708.1 DUF2127 domain-containing protein [Subtercola sp. RTI3]
MVIPAPPLTDTEHAPRRRSILDRFYFLAVIVKGVDGAVELLAGLLLWLAPAAVHGLLAGIVNEANEGHTAAHLFIASNIGHLDSQLAHQNSTFLTAFLIVHGVVKIALVYCLLKRFHRAYPWALSVLTVFLAYQVYALVTTPTLSMAIFTALDVVIIYLVWREYRELKSHVARPNVPARSDSN